MTFKRVGRLASWLLIAVIASITTAGVFVVVVALNSSATPVSRHHGDLFGFTDAGLWLGIGVAALAPWWALGAVALQTHRHRRGC